MTTLAALRKKTPESWQFYINMHNMHIIVLNENLTFWRLVGFSWVLSIILIATWERKTLLEEFYQMY